MIYPIILPTSSGIYLSLFSLICFITISRSSFKSCRANLRFITGWKRIKLNLISTLVAVNSSFWKASSSVSQIRNFVQPGIHSWPLGPQLSSASQHPDIHEEGQSCQGTGWEQAFLSFHFSEGNIFHHSNGDWKCSLLEKNDEFGKRGLYKS